MSVASGANSVAIGSITEGPTSTLAERTLEFVETELVAWRDDPDRAPEQSEERLNAQLCKFLNVAASEHFPMVLFSHEEKQTGARRVDIAANPRRGIIIGAVYHSIYDPFIVFEGKRLPAPSKDREREYVTGGTKKSGGIQRFKRGLHGAKQETAVIVGYIQEISPASWLSQLNEWIAAEATTSSVEDEQWAEDEPLTGFAHDVVKRSAQSSSKHRRENSSTDTIRLRHLWIEM
jgi:hypothetical protein